MAGNTIKLLEQVLDYSALNQKVISKNIANVGTVGYKKNNVDFEEILSQNLSSGLKRTDSRHFNISNLPGNSEAPFKIVKDENEENISGMNNVDINEEMADLAKNQIMFKFAARKVNEYYQLISNAIKGGR
jgi:flagellar basal-body rod protein FlgB